MGRLAAKPKLDRPKLTQRIKQMLAEGKTQIEIAVELGISQSTVRNWAKDP